jgi:uncharacterized membrane protein YeaQ/YmgE (transglycosylase-associated protein family)
MGKWKTHGSAFFKEKAAREQQILITLQCDPWEPNWRKLMQIERTILCGLVAGLLASQMVSGSETRSLSREVLRDKIMGGWVGKMAGAAYGTPDEFKAQGKIMNFIPKWEPNQAAMSINNDDLYVQMTFAAVLDQVGMDATSEQFGEAFKNSKYDLCHANAGARRNLNRGIKPPWSGHPKYNFHSDDIDFQIEADFIGLMCPGLPRLSNQYCERVGRVMNYGDGLYGGMWLCGMYSAAFFETDMVKIIDAGLACIPSRSQYAKLIRDVVAWHAQYPDDWKKCWQLLEDKWDRNDVCPEGALAPFNIDAKFNGGYIALGLLYGRGDLGKTIEIATIAGQDSDCNPGNAAGVLGVIMGYDKIPEVWKAGIPKVMDTRFAYTDVTLRDVITATEKHALELIKRAGGKVTDTKVIIPRQTPKAAKFEEWPAGVPFQKVGVEESPWTWQGNWTNSPNGRTSTNPNNEVTFKFKGVAVAVVGPLSKEGGRAEVYVDGKKSPFILDAYVEPKTHDNILWHVYGLKPGEHTLRIVTIAEADARSKARKITIEKAVLYRAK